MLGLSNYPRVRPLHGEIERRLELLEQAVERGRGRVNASATDAADRFGEIIASALNRIADRYRHGSHSMGDEVAKIGGAAADLGDEVLQRLSREVKHRPLVTLALAIGVGILIGVLNNRR
jgi:ElaB/YqjD/DUF883 family membrane-anchored ribosome-binding protein